MRCSRSPAQRPQDPLRPRSSSDRAFFVRYSVSPALKAFETKNHSPRFRLASGSASTRFTTSASRPIPAEKRKYRSLMRPTCTRRVTILQASFSATKSVASTGSRGSPSERAMTFVLPPGMNPNAEIGADQRLHGLVDRSVPTERDHRVEIAIDGIGSEFARVIAVLRIDRLDLEVGLERLEDHVSASRS